MTTSQALGHYLKALAIVVLTVPLTAATGNVRIIQTNSAGDNVHVIDPVTNKVVGIIEGIEVSHGATATPDGSRIYVSNEADHTLDVVDGKTLKVIKKIVLSGRPNNIASGKDGRRVYVSIAAAPGGVDVIDTASAEKVKTIPTKGTIHNTYVTPDGKYVVSGSIPAKNITVIDAKTEQVAWTFDFDLGVRPPWRSARIPTARPNGSLRSFPSSMGLPLSISTHARKSLGSRTPIWRLGRLR